MASIRKLKKDINYLAYELLTEAYTYKHFHPEIDEKKFNDVIKKIVGFRSKLILNIKYKNDNDSIKKTDHYQKIQDDMVEMVGLMKTLNE